MTFTRRRFLEKAVLAALLAVGSAACSKNPLATTAPSGPSQVSYAYAAEDLSLPGVYFAPQCAACAVTKNLSLAVAPTGSGAATAGGPAMLDIGLQWYTLISGPLVRNTSLDLASAYVCNMNTTPINIFGFGKLANLPFSGNPATGYTTPNPNDYFVRYAGSFSGWGIPNSATQYSQLQFFYNAATGPGADISAYRGFSFYTRGSGNFSVCLVSGSQAGSPPASGPYIQLNYYTQMINTSLNGSMQWKEVTVYFSQMTQLYGLATPLSEVLTNFWGLQFMQQAPVADQFWLDVDYIRFF
jgi:hypothetical protein